MRQRNLSVNLLKKTKRKYIRHLNEKKLSIKTSRKKIMPYLNVKGNEDHVR